MTPLLKLAIAISTISLFCVGCGAQESPESSSAAVVEPEKTSEDESARISAFFAAAYARELAQDPETQSMRGLKTDDQDKWFDDSDLAAAENIEERKGDLIQLHAFNRNALSPDQQLSYDLLEFELEQLIRDAPFRRHSYVVDQFNGQVTNKISFLLNAHTIESERDAEDYIARIRGLEKVYLEMTARLRDRASFGVMTPAFAYADMISDISGLGTGYPIDESTNRHVLLEDFTAKLAQLDLDPSLSGDLVLGAEQAISGPFKSGIDSLVAEITRQSAMVEENNGVWALPDGEDFYQAQIEGYTTLNLTADEVHQTGLDDVARIHKEMKSIMQELGFEGTLQEFFVFSRTDPSNFYNNSPEGQEAFLADARAQTAEIFAVANQYFNKLPEAGLEVRKVEAWRENSTSIAFYEQPSQDGSRPGYYYANLKDLTAYQKSVSTAITYHEGVPGHHFQIALAQELEDLPMFRKFGGNGAYIEGWALYAEQLAREMGFYQDPMSNFGRLHDEIWRSARLVIDTGIHAKRWTREQAIEYFRWNTPLSEADMVTEVERFFVTPGQALGYKIGMMKILELRARAKEQLGEGFDIRFFHDVVIGQGAMPMPILEAQVDAYLSAQATD
ncbi:MAG: hypothetical protein ACI9A2_003989 [Halioglobus sp.]|jgi:uncharacterized protein (DUF885 family)